MVPVDTTAEYEAEYQARSAALSAGLQAARRSGLPAGLGKTTSNLFRHRQPAARHTLDVRAFDHVLSIDRERMTADVEGMITYEALVRETLRYGLLPAVVPQLKTITVGGAVSGLGIESSSFKYGLVHETVEAMEILTGNGDIVDRSEEHTSELQSPCNLVCRILIEKKDIYWLLRFVILVKECKSYGTEISIHTLHNDWYNFTMCRKSGNAI